jgi:hypothetical protein
MADAPAIEQAYDATGFYWDPVGQKWIASCKIFRNGKRARGYAESQDFVHWSDTYLMLTTDEQDHPQDQIYSMRIFRYESVYVGLPKIYHVATDQCDLQVAFSRNARHWERPDRTPFVANSPTRGDCDHGNIDDAGDPIRVGDELWFYYSGRACLHQEEPRDTDGSLCLATLRVDGFVSLDAGGQEGVLLTRPLRLQGESLYLNAEAQGGEIRVEVVEGKDEAADGPIKALSPFVRANCTPLTADRVRQPVVWERSPGLGALGGRPVRLRFYLRNARLYSFWTE